MPTQSIARHWLPPRLIEHLRPLLRKGIYFSGRYPDWNSALARSSGYDSQLILERVRESLLKVKQRKAKCERDSVLFDEMQYSFPILAGLLRAAADHQQRLAVVDFGGSLGSTYFQCMDFLSVIPSLSWGVVEQPHFVAAGRELFESNQLNFFNTISECVAQIRPNVALLSSVLQYLPAPDVILSELSEADISYVLIDRTPFSALRDDQITVQHVPASIYPASYPCRIFAEQPFMTHLESHYEIIARFKSDDSNAVAAGTPFFFGGAILRKKRK